MTGVPLSMDYFSPLALLEGLGRFGTAYLFLLLVLALAANFRRTR